MFVRWCAVVAEVAGHGRREVVVLATVVTVAPDASATARSRTRMAAALDRQNLRLAALDVQAQALAGGALRHPVRSARPAVVLFRFS